MHYKNDTELSLCWAFLQKELRIDPKVAICCDEAADWALDIQRLEIQKLADSLSHTARSLLEIKQNT
jgi:hypothetical protein